MKPLIPKVNHLKLKIILLIQIILFLSLTTYNKINEKQHFIEQLTTSNFINSDQFNYENIKQLIINRIKYGIYNDYEVDLCCDSLNRCNIPEFDKYKNKDGTYKTTIYDKEWETYSEHLKSEIINEIIYYTWGNKKSKFNPLYIKNSQSIFNLLNPYSSDMFMTFSKKEYLKGGKGKKAYAPNCWYNSISAIVDSSTKFSKLNRLNSSKWDHPRFMGPAEFHCFIGKFEKVAKPKFGDIIRYYTDSLYYDESKFIYNGEIHAAVFIGSDTMKRIFDVVLTKNGRNDLGFLIFQDAKKLDSLYLSKKDINLKKGYFRVKASSSFIDPVIYGKCSDCYEAYKLDSLNYNNRWNCLADKMLNDTCKNKCNCYPEVWKIYK